MRKLYLLALITTLLTIRSELRSAEPSIADQVRHSKIFLHDLIWIGETEPQPSESQALIGAIQQIKTTGFQAGLAGLEQFVADYPDSAWTPSIRANLASNYRAKGRYSMALNHWQKAWDRVKDANSGNGALIGDQVVAQWTELLSSLGRTELLKQLLSETEGRQFADLMLARTYSHSISNLRFMKENPGLSYRCGTFALAGVAMQLGIPNERLLKIKGAASPMTGFSISDLVGFSKDANLGLVAVKRPQGSAIIVPSLVHWREQHYAAITKQEGKKYFVVDPTFGESQWLSSEAIDDETDGYFMVPESQKPPGWDILSDLEAKAIFGKGWLWADPPPPPPPCNAPPGQCCINHGGGGGGGGGGGDPSGPSGPPPRCRKCQADGMPAWYVREPYTTLWLVDQPMRFTAGQQKEIPIKLTYNQEETKPDNTNIFNLGRNWNMNVLSYVDIINTEGDNLFNHYEATIYGPEGGQVKYYSDNHNNNGLPAYDYYTKATFTILNDEQNVTGIRMSFPDGTVFTYGFVVTTVDQGTNAEDTKEKVIFLTNRTDPGGHTELDLNYSTNSLGHIFLNTISDPNEGNAVTFYYDTTKSVQITTISNTYGKTVKFQYDTNRMMTNITDVVGLSSSFTYLWTNSIPIVTKLTTPYGDTSFDYINPNGQLFGASTNADRIDRAIRAHKPNGDTELFMYRHDSTVLNKSGTNTFIPSSYGDAPDIGETDLLKGLADAYMSYRNSFYWDPNQYATLSTTNLVNLSTNDYSKARLRNWLIQFFSDPGTTAVGETINMERESSPDGVTAGQKTWYAYWGKKSGGFQPSVQGTNLYPSYIARRSPNGESDYVFMQYNALRKPTLEVTTYSGDGGALARRTNSYVYSSDNLDLLLAFDRSGNQVASNIYSSHLLMANYNALSEATIYMYDTNGRLISLQRPSGLTTTNIYDANGFLTKTVDLEITRTNSYTYASGLPLTQTDERGLTRTFSWDALNRPVSTTFPDTTYTSNRYTYLDLTARKDRLGYWTYFRYDSLRRKIAETNALGGVTAFSYCTCGSPDAITDPLNNTTHFYYDLVGHQIGKVFPDGTWMSNRFDLFGRVTNVFDSAGMKTTNWYNNQGLLIGQTNQLGCVKAMVYDIEDRMTNGMSADGVSSGFRYDLLGRFDRRYTGIFDEQFTYSPRGLVAYVGLGERFSNYDLDPAGRKVVEINNNSEVIGFTYNPAGDLWLMTNAMQNMTEWGHDEYGRITSKQVSFGAPNFVQYAYDANGRLTNRWSLEKGDAYYNYDALGNLTSVDYAVSPDLSFAYDANGRLTTMVDAAGTTRYTYTSFGAVASEDGPWANDAVSYSYANQLRTALSLDRASAPPLANTYGYDAAKRLTSLSSWAGSFSYLYDSTARMHVSRISLPNGSYVTNTYDGMAQMTGTYLKNNSGTVLNSHQYSYSAFNYQELSRQTRTDGSYLDYGYDGIGQLTAALGKESGGTTNRLNEQFRYSYDKAGNLRCRTNNAFEQWFTMTGDQIDNVARGNTLTVVGTSSSGATNVTVNSSNAVRYADTTFAQAGLTLTNDGMNVFTAIAKDSSGRTDTNTVSPLLYSVLGPSYDQNGNMTSDGINVYEYDDENQLTAVYPNSGSTTWRAEFVYDGKMRRRIRKEFSGNVGAWVLTNEVHYIYDGSLVIEERDALNAPIATYTRGKDLSGSLQGAGGIGGLLARTDDRNGTTAFYHADRLGNVTMLINAQQVSVAKYLYDPFGNMLSASGPLADANLYRFSTKEIHPGSGLVYYLYRFYAPNLQRWISADPVREQGFRIALRHRESTASMRLSRLLETGTEYAFVKNGPSQRYDPWGLFEGEDESKPVDCKKLGSEIKEVKRMIGHELYHDYATTLLDQLQEFWDDNCDDDDGDEPKPPTGPLVPCPSYNWNPSKQQQKSLELTTETLMLLMLLYALLASEAAGN